MCECAEQNGLAVSAFRPGKLGRSGLRPYMCLAVGQKTCWGDRDGDLPSPLRERIRGIEDDARGQVVVGGEAGGFAVAQLAQVCEFALHDFFVGRTQELLFEGYEVHAFVHRFDKGCSVERKRLGSRRREAEGGFGFFGAR